MSGPDAAEATPTKGFFGGVANGFATLGKSASTLLQGGEASPGKSPAKGFIDGMIERKRLADEISEIDKDTEEATVSALAVAKQKTAEAREMRAAMAVANANADANADADAKAEELSQAAVLLQARVRGHAARSAVEPPASPSQLSPVAAPAASPNGPQRAPSLGSVQRRDTTSTLMGLMGSTDVPGLIAPSLSSKGGSEGGGARRAAEATEVMLYVHKGERMTRLGLSLGNPEGDKGEAAPVVALVAVASGSVGADSGLVVGDVLLAVNGDAVTKHEDAREKIARAVGTLQLTLRLPRLSGGPKAQEHLMRAGHNANKAMDYYTARRHFSACHELGGRVEALISAVNMTLKLEEYQRAAEQYGELLRRDLEPPVMKIIERKHREAVDKLAAQKLLRAENNAVGSQDHLPAVAVQAFPVEEEGEGEGDEGPAPASRLGQLLHIFSAGTAVPKTANSGLCCVAKRT